MIYETQYRTLAKTISYRTLGSLSTALFVFILTLKVEVALAVGGLEVISKLFLFYFHERLWNRVPFGKREVQPAVIWISGLSGSKKKDLATSVYKELKERKLKVELLNGETLRSLIPNIGFSKDQRIDHIKRVGYFASIMEKNGIFTICSFISPDKSSRDFVRSLCKNFIEVHVNTPIDECKKNDENQIYEKALSGKLEHVAGVHYPYEESTQVELSINLSKTPISLATKKIIDLSGI